MASPYLTIGQVAQKLGVSTRTVRNWWLSGKTSLQAWCPGHMVGKSGLKFTRKSVEVFVAQGHVKPEEYTE